MTSSTPTAETTPRGPFEISAAQVEFFNTFGYLHLPGWFAPEIDSIIDGFEAKFAGSEPVLMDASNPYHVATSSQFESHLREIVTPFVDDDPALGWLPCDPRLTGLVAALLGPAEYRGSDGNRFNCDVHYHADVYLSPLRTRNLKIYFYLEELEAETGALRMIPGTNFYLGPFARALQRDLQSPDHAMAAFGMRGDQVPAVVLPTVPGDIVVGDFRTLHGSFGGAPGRRLFTLNYRKIEA